MDQTTVKVGKNEDLGFSTIIIIRASTASVFSAEDLINVLFT